MKRRLTLTVDVEVEGDNGVAATVALLQATAHLPDNVRILSATVAERSTGRRAQRVELEP